MSDRVFVDTDVLVYAHDRGAGRRHELASALVRNLWRRRSGVIGTQVIRELYVNVRRKASRPIGLEEARRLVEDYLYWEVVVNDGRTIRGALDIEERSRVSFRDPLILQSEKVAGVETLYSEDLSHGQLYDGVRVIDPSRDRESASAR